MKLNKTQKQVAVFAGMAGVAGLGFMVLNLADTSDQLPEPPQTSSLTGNVDTREVSLSSLAVRMTNIEDRRDKDGDLIDDRLSSMESTLERVITALNDKSILEQNRQQDIALRSLGGRMTGLESLIGNLADQLENGDFASPTPMPTITPDVEEPEPSPDLVLTPLRPEQDPQTLYDPVPEMPLTAGGPAGAPPTQPAPRIATYEPEMPSAEDSTLAATIPPLVIPAGSIITTQLMTGMDAPTGTQAEAAPVPILMRIKRDAIMPNNAFADVIDCHLLGSGYGELSSERVQIRGEIASCVLSDGSVYEGKAKFFASGEDGKVGVRGTLISKAGRALGLAAKAGFAEGVTEILSAQAMSDSISTGSVLSAGAIGASENAFNKLADYYIDLAEQTFPVLEITNGRWVDVILTQRLEVVFDSGVVQ